MQKLLILISINSEIFFMKVAIVYHYYEFNEIYRDNYIFFMNCALDSMADFYVMISGDCSVPEIIKDNIKYVYVDNKNHDFGGVCEFVSYYGNLKYDYYLFVNSSMRGPFLPSYYSKNWYHVFTECLTRN